MIKDPEERNVILYELHQIKFTTLELMAIQGSINTTLTLKKQLQKEPLVLNHIKSAENKIMPLIENARARIESVKT